MLEFNFQYIMLVCVIRVVTCYDCTMYLSRYRDRCRRNI